MMIDKKKQKLMNEYELRNKQEIDEFVAKINEMRVNLENERQKELDGLTQKYDKIKNQLTSIQKSENKRLQNFKNYKVVTMVDDDTMLNETKSRIDFKSDEKSLMHSKKKVLMNRVKRMNN